MVKADGCVAIHSDGGAYKPLNWMNSPNHLDEQQGEWTITNPSGETLVIRFEEVFADVRHELGVDPGLAKDGVEADLQHLLSERPFVLEEGLTLLRREYQTGIGPVDLLCRDSGGQVVAVEVKRRGEIDGVEQLTRYLDRLNRDPTLAPVRGILAAAAIAPQARTLAAGRGISCVEVDHRHLLGLDGNAPRLFDL
jgi:RecB family endonuclease NucS